MSKQRSQQILGLDLLRATAAVLVMLFHYTFWNWAHNPVLRPQWPALYQALSPYTSAGWVGVEIFFVISGFIITYSVQNIGPATFVRHRVTRLLPAAFLCASLTAAVLVATHTATFPVAAGLWLRSVTFWPLRPWIDGSYWTLPVEVSFYFVVFLCLSIKRQMLPVVMTVIGAASTYCNLVALPKHLQQPFLLMLHGCLFGFGVFLYEVLNRGFTWARGGALALCFAGSLTEVATHHQPLADGLWLGGVLFLIASVRFNADAQRVVGVRGGAFLRRVGLATYPLYLVHDQVGNLLIEALHRRAAVPYSWALGIAMVSMAALAGGIAQLAEPRVRRALQALMPRTEDASHPPGSQRPWEGSRTSAQ